MLILSLYSDVTRELIRFKYFTSRLTEMYRENLREFVWNEDSRARGFPVHRYRECTTIESEFKGIVRKT